MENVRQSLLSYVFPEIDAEQLLPEAKPENDKKTAVVAKASDAGNDNGTYIQKDHSEQQLLEKSLQEDHFVNLEGDCKADEAEVLLIKIITRCLKIWNRRYVGA